MTEDEGLTRAEWKIIDRDIEAREAADDVRALLADAGNLIEATHRELEALEAMRDTDFTEYMRSGSADRHLRLMTGE